MTWTRNNDKAPIETLSFGTGAQAYTVDVALAMNASPLTRKVMLRKVADDDNNTTNPYGAIQDAQFTIYYADRQTVVKLQRDKKDGDGKVVTGADGKPVQETYLLKDLVSGASGAYFIGELPCGTYYIEETDSAGYNKPTHYFVLEVKSTGAMVRELAESTDAGDLIPAPDSGTQTGTP